MSIGRCPIVHVWLNHSLKCAKVPDRQVVRLRVTFESSDLHGIFILRCRRHSQRNS